MVSESPEIRALIARVAAHSRWAQVPDRSAATAPGRKAAMDRFERLVDPDGTLAPAERAKRAENARKAHFSRMALLSVQARKARRLAEELEQQVQDGGQD